MEFRLLGPLEVLDDDRTVALPHGRARALLALLALQVGKVVATDRLVDELWAGRPPRTAVTAIQGLISALRKRLEPAGDGTDPHRVLRTHTPGYVLAVDPDQIDAHRFRRLVEDSSDAPPRERAGQLRTALALWRGPALADFAYEPFAQAPIAALEELRLTALDARIGADLALGRHAEVTAELEELVADHPLRESLRAQLMLALYRCDRQAEALEVYRVARRDLAEDLGMEPGPRLRALEHAVLTHDPSLRAPDPGPLAGSGNEGSAATEGAWLDKGRRAVTAMFVDLSVVGAAADTDRVDPEVSRPVVGRGVATVRDVLREHGGTLEGVVGDVVVALFGLPVAHEDDAVRAVRAAAELRRRLADLNTEADRTHAGTRLSARMGIETGEVVVGGPIEGMPATSGPPVARAARLQQAAEHAEVLLGDATRRIVDEVALVDPVADSASAGAGAPAWRLVEVRAEPSGLAAAGTAPVGRVDELAALRTVFDRVVREGRAALVIVTGEAGVGKSRLARAFTESVSNLARVVIGHCRAYGAGITFWPLREIVQGLVDGDAQEGLQRLLGTQEAGAAHAAGIAAATGLTDEPMRRPDDLFVAVRRLIEAAGSDQPLVVLVEDVHWAQPTLLDLLEYLAEVARAPVLLLCLSRPDASESRPRWATEVKSATPIQLYPLGSAESRQLISDRLDGRLLIPETMDRVLAMGQGNPLFLEQLLAALREDDDVTIPPNVQALLTARLDRLVPAERDLLRCASVVGVEIPVTALGALVPDEVRANLDRHMKALDTKEMLHLLWPPSGEPVLEFRHVLIQQAAYRSLTRAARADLHERVAAWFETEAGIPPIELEEVVGRHLEQAVRHRRDLGHADDTMHELMARAGERLASAGLRAYDRFDVPAAENLLSRARALLPADHPRRRQVLRRLTEAYPVMGRPGEATDCFEELLEVVGRDGDDTASRGVRLEQLRFQLITGPDGMHMATARQEIEDSLAAFRRADDRVLVSQAHYVLASVHLRSGHMEELAEVAWRGIERAQRAGEMRERLGAAWWVVFHLLAGPIPAPACVRTCEEVLDVGGMQHLGVLAALGHFRAMLGEIDEGRKLVDRARELLRERIRLPRPLAFIEHQGAGVELLAGNREAAAGCLRRALDVALQVTERERIAQIAGHLSLLLSRQGEPDEAAWLARLALEQAPREDVTAQALAGAARARAAMGHGDIAEAEMISHDGIDRVPADMLDLRAQLQVCLAEILDAAGRPEDAREVNDEAVDLYKRKGNLMAAQRTSVRK